MRWPSLVSQTFASSSSSPYIAVYEEESSPHPTNQDDDVFLLESSFSTANNNRSSNPAKLARRLRALNCWKSNNSTNKPTTTCLDSTALLTEDDLLTMVRQDGGGVSCTSSSCPVADDASSEQQQDEPSSFKKKHQDIFVPKSVSLWKRLWRGFKRQGSPLVCLEDAISTTDSTEDYGGGDAIRSPAHFSVSTQRPRRVKTTTASDAAGMECIEMEWPSLSVPSEESGNYLYLYMDHNNINHNEENNNESSQASPRRGFKKMKRTVEFDQMSPCDSTSVGSAVLAVSFDNQQECAQLVFQSFSSSSSSEDACTAAVPLGAQYAHPSAATSKVSLAKQQQLSRKQCPQSYMDWIAMEDDPLFASSSASVEVSLTDYENAGWSSFDENASFSSLLSSSKLFQPICRYEEINPTDSFLFVPPSYFAGCFSHGPTLVAARNEDEQEEEHEIRSEVSSLPPPSLIGLK